MTVFGGFVLNGPMFPLQQNDDHDRQHAGYLSTYRYGLELFTDRETI